MSQPRIVLFNHAPGYRANTAQIIDEIKKLGFEVLETTDSHKALELLMSRKDIGFVLTDEEGLKVSGTGLVQRMQGRNIDVPSAVIADKEIPSYRVPVSFRRPVEAVTVAKHVASKYAVPAPRAA
jgi:hypothetical protein